MISKDKQYKTKGGEEVRIYATDGCYNHPVHGAVKGQYGWVDTSWTLNGKFNAYVEKESEKDLIEVKPAKTIWIEVCLFGSEIVVAHHETKKEAEESVAESNRSEQFKHIDLIKKTYEL